METDAMVDEYTNPHHLGPEKFPYQRLFAPTPITGVLTPYGEKNIAHALVFMSTIIIWANAADVDASFPPSSLNCFVSAGVPKCTGLCVASFPFVVAFTCISGAFITLNVLAYLGIMVSRYGFFSHFKEFQLMIIYVILSSILLALNANPESVSTSIGEGFTWVCFFMSIYGMYQAFHTYKENDTPFEAPEIVHDENNDGFFYG